jgi:hypothetical protein
VSNSEATGDVTPTTEARPGGCLAHRTIFLVLHVAVDVQRLLELGKKYPWPRPGRCLSCKSSRIWGHGYVQRYFEGFLLPLWIRRLRCADCGTVYTLRPDRFYRGFRYPLLTILSSLMTKIADGWWLPSVPRQNQQYWFKGLRLQAQRLRNVPFPDTDTVGEIVSRCLIPVSHSLNCAMLRL